MFREKIKIEKNTVQETLIIPLYGRKICYEKFPELYKDDSAKRLCDSLDYDFSEQEAKKDNFLYQFGALEAAMRQLDMMWEIRQYLKEYPEATIVNLGCGLDRTAKMLDNGQCRMVNIDFPDIIAIRQMLLPSGDRERNLSYDLKDFAWMDEVSGEKGVIFFAAGVFHYFQRRVVQKMVLEMADRFPKGRLVFDSVGKLGLKLMLRKTLKNMGITKVEGFFSVDNPQKELKWSQKITVSARGYMLGYYDRKLRNTGWRNYLLAKIGDGFFNMAIIRMDFK